MWGIIPVADTRSPMHSYLVERMLRAGATRICFVLSPGTFDVLEHYGGSIGLAHVSYTVQPKATGLCDSIFRALPMITLTGTRDQITAISKLPAVRSIYGNRTLNLNSEPEVRAVTGVERAWRDAEITISNHNLPVTGKNITVAVLDTGVDGNHGDLGGRVAKNIKLASIKNAEGTRNTEKAAGNLRQLSGTLKDLVHTNKS